MNLACINGNCLAGPYGVQLAADPTAIQNIPSYPKIVAAVALAGAAAGAAAGVAAAKGSPKLGAMVGAVLGGFVTGWLSSTFVVTSSG